MIRYLLALFLLPAIAFGQVDLRQDGGIQIIESGQAISLGDGIKFTVPNYDSDAQIYFATAGVTDPVAKKQISDFAKGVKALGLWNNMVCWMLRSSQNAGTGTTAYSLGGLGTYNGTIVNGPSWGADGMGFVSASSQYITLLEMLSDGDSFSMFVVGKYANSSAANLTLLSNGSGTIPRGVLLGASGNSVTTPRNISWDKVGSYSGSPVMGSATDNLWFTSASASNASNITFYQNNVSLGGFSGDYRMSGNTGPNPAIGAWQNNISSLTSYFNGSISMAAVFKIALSGSQFTAINILYKSTIGTGLSLP